MGETNMIESPVLFGTNPQHDCFPLALKVESTIQAEVGVVVKLCEAPSKVSVKEIRVWELLKKIRLNIPIST
jgi:hypothetical protein